MFALLTILAAGSVASADIRPLLREQGFQGPLNGREQIEYVGHILVGRDDYRIYVYEGVFKPHPQGVDHGVNRIILILNGSSFLGDYPIGMPTKCEVRAQTVVCDTQSPGVIDFSDKGPPPEIWFDGEVLQFELATRSMPRN